MTTVTQHDEAQIFARVARELAEQDGLQPTLDRVPVLARVLTGCDSATVWTINRQSQPVVSAATDPVLAESHAEAVLTMAEGPDWECLHARSVVIVDDIRAEPRWPVYAQLALLSAAPFLSLVAYPLGGVGEGSGALVLASREAGHFTDGLVQAGAVFAEHAWLAVHSATGWDKAGNLEAALESNRRIGIALGVIMAGHRCTADQAFDRLRTASQITHSKLREVAEEVIFTGAVPEAPAPRVEPTPMLRSA
jgi:GAF domain-containing protein